MTREADRSIADVLKDIAGNLQQIVRSEMRLAQIEVREEVSKLAHGGIFIAIGVFLGLLSIGFLLLAGVYLLATVLALWLAATIVAIVTAAIGSAFVLGGKAQLKRVSLPRKTVTSLKENIRWVKAPTN